MRVLFSLGVVTFLFGCVVPAHKMLIASGGSKAHGIVEMSYSHGRFENPVVDMNQAAFEARRVCSGWGYFGAQVFGSSQKRCELKDRSGCLSWQVTIPYQCTTSKTE
jgi:hypothetical protein